jgi:hypothetical protein
MKFTTHESDLYCLPEDDTEKKLLQKYVKERCAVWSFSNVEGQDWYGKTFLDIPFGSFLKAEIEAAL